MSGSLVIGGQLGNYMIESVVGRGGMSVVYRAVHARLGTPVALKVLAPELSSDDAFRERFLREAKMAAGIDHPNVIPIYDTGLHEDSLYIVMRYVGGGDLKTLLANSGSLEPEQAVAVLTPVARALDAAHAQGLVHRDVKPANVLLQRSPSGEIDHVYLSDFGITKHVSSVSGLTKTGALVGTLDYVAPEQIEGREVTAQTDVYALGCLFYQCITGRVPHHRESDAAVLWAHMREEVEPASKVQPGLPSTLDGPISRALAKVPAARFETCEEFVRAASDAARAGEGRLSDLAGLAAAAGSAPSEPVFVGAAPTAGAAAPPPRAPTGQHSGRGRARGWLAGHWWVAGLFVLALGGVAAAIALISGGSSSSSEDADSFPATLFGVPTNHVSGSGDAVVKLRGNTATVTVNTSGLLDSAPHAMHIHAGGTGRCPPADAAHRHNGRLSISTVDGEPFYGPPVTALTTKGDISTKSILAFPRYPHDGNIRFTRRITLPAQVASAIRRRKASVIVHGIDYNGNGLYDSVLDRSELDRHLPGEATAPGICGPLLVAQGQKASAGGAQTYTATLSMQPTDVVWSCNVPDSPGSGRQAAAGI
jgi:Protein kinase domain